MECGHNPRDLLNVQSDSFDCETSIELKSGPTNILRYSLKSKHLSKTIVVKFGKIYRQTSEASANISANKHNPVQCAQY